MSDERRPLDDSGGRYVLCPICNKKVISVLINTHLDAGCDRATPSKPKRPRLDPDYPPLSQSSQVFVDLETQEPLTIPTPLSLTEPVIKPPPQASSASRRPLADRIRPTSFEDLFGNDEIIGRDSFLQQAIKKDTFPSLIFWGPPGCGKTTIAMIVARTTKKQFLHLSATDSGVKDIQGFVQRAQNHQKLTGEGSILFIDEIHRYNKKQQDCFLPYVENGTFTLIGATTENPSFSLNSALLSRCRVEKLAPLSKEALHSIVLRCLQTYSADLKIDEEAESHLSTYSNGDARIVLNAIEQILQLAPQATVIDKDSVLRVLHESKLLYDRDGDEHYDTISAFHKSLATLYYLARMLEGGEDPLFVGRRMIRAASEDIGLADPMALEQAVLAYRACQLIGMPECKLALAQAAVYCAAAPKSNELYTAYQKVSTYVNNNRQHKIPYHIRNAPTGLMQGLGYGEGYKYPPDFDYNCQQTFLPEEIKDEVFVDTSKLRGFGRFAP